MPQKQWAVGEEVLAADFNTYLQNQVVPQFTTPAQRDSQWASAPAGAMCITTDTSTLWQRVGSNWHPCFKRISGTTSAINGPASAAEVAVLASGSTVWPSGRLCRVVAGWRTASGVAGDGMIVRLRDGGVAGTEIANQTVVFGSSGALGGVGSGGIISCRAFQPSVGSHTFTLTSAATATNAVTMITGGTNSPIFVDVYDVGAA